MDQLSNPTEALPVAGQVDLEHEVDSNSANRYDAYISAADSPEAYFSECAEVLLQFLEMKVALWSMDLYRSSRGRTWTLLLFMNCRKLGNIDLR